MSELPLADRESKPTRKGDPALSAQQIEQYENQLGEWSVIDNHRLQRRFEFADFQTALDFVNRAGAIAEAEDHHPDIAFGWGYAEFQIWTHVVGGLSENDFILAAKINRLAS